MTNYLHQPYNGFVGFDEDKELKVAVPGGFLVFPSVQAEAEGCSYVRFMDRQGIEQLYWVYDEWVEDPQCVMGAIMGAIYAGPGQEHTEEELRHFYGEEAFSSNSDARPALPAPDGDGSTASPKTE